jgi:hypothetical protein
MMQVHNIPFTYVRVFILASFSLLVACTQKTPLKKKLSTNYTLTKDTTLHFQQASFHFIPKTDTVFATQALFIEKLSAKNNQEINKGIVVLRAKNQQSFQTLSKEKQALKSLLLNTTPPTVLSDEFQDWTQFAQSIKEDELLPLLPKMKFKEEVELLKRIGAIDKINSIIKMEKEMKQFFIQSPKKGSIHYLSIQANQRVKKGSPLFTITSPNEGSLILEGKFPHLSKGNQLFIEQQLIEITSEPSYHNGNTQVNVRSSIAIPSKGTVLKKSQLKVVKVEQSAVKHSAVFVMKDQQWQKKDIEIIYQDNQYVYTNSLKSNTRIRI